MTRLAHMLAAAAAFFGLGPAPVPAGNRPPEIPKPAAAGARKRQPKAPKAYARRAPVLPVVAMYPGPGQRRADMTPETEARVRATQRAQALAATNPRTRHMYGLGALGGAA